MPKRTDLKSILIIGAGPIVIGQACEFDYSGAQACKALREEGYKVILVNSNPATIMTDPAMADVTYIEPIHLANGREDHCQRAPRCHPAHHGRSDRAELCAGFGQTRRAGKYNVELIGATPDAIDKAEDRRPFKDAMPRSAWLPQSGMCATPWTKPGVQEEGGLSHADSPSRSPWVARAAALPTIKKNFWRFAKRGLDASPTNELLIEQSLLGWKEYEMEVVRDRKRQLHHHLLD
jgi:carbamoyl-phosphate synthase large subunit